MKIKYDRELCQGLYVPITMELGRKVGSRRRKGAAPLGLLHVPTYFYSRGLPPFRFLSRPRKRL